MSNIEPVGWKDLNEEAKCRIVNFFMNMGLLDAKLEQSSNEILDKMATQLKGSYEHTHNRVSLELRGVKAVASQVKTDRQANALLSAFGAGVVSHLPKDITHPAKKHSHESGLSM